MAFEQHLKNKKAIILGLDNVLYPEKDYLLQVYYLFAEFISYQEQIDAKQILNYMTEEFTANGEEFIFEKTAAQFNIPLKYSSNFILLHSTARLPLKLLLYNQILSFLQEIVAERITIFLLVDGTAAIQLNKIKQLEWHGLEKHLTVYFTEEFEFKSSEKTLEFIIKEHQLTKEEILILGYKKEDEDLATLADIDFLSILNLL